MEKSGKQKVLFVKDKAGVVCVITFSLKPAKYRFMRLSCSTWSLFLFIFTTATQSYISPNFSKRLSWESYLEESVCTCNVLGPVHHSEHASLLDHAGTYDLVLVCSHPEGHLGS